ncbi:MAG: hypothetical protein ACYCZ0_01595 [Minisyncoccota bacterium]
MQETKQRIKKVVSDYIKLFPAEYSIVCKGVEMKKKMTRDQFASIEGMFEGRGLYEISETLDAMLTKYLPEEDMVWLKSGGINHKEGGRWFAKTFPEFSLPDKI